MRPALRGAIEFAETVRRITDGGPRLTYGVRRTPNTLNRHSP